MFDGECRLT